MTSPGLPRVFYAYIALLAVGTASAIAMALARGDDFFAHPLTFVALTALLIALESTDLHYYDDRAQVGLSAGEAVLLPMLVVLSFGQVVVAAVLTMAIARFRNWGKSPLKETFNVAQYALAAGSAAGLWAWLRDGAMNFSIHNAGVATAAVIFFALLTHVFVAIGLHLARRGNVVDLLKEVAPVALLNLGGNIILGLFFAASYIAAPWTVVLFPVPLAALYFGFRAVVRQRGERQRVERLHAASRALASSPDLGTALTHFLGSVANMLSATGARAVVRVGNELMWSGVRGGEAIADMVPASGDPMSIVLYRVTSADGPVIIGEDDADELKEMLPARNLAAVPLRDGDGSSGAIVVIDRVGADEFDPGDISLLEALANELALALESRRLFDEATAERERFHLLVEAVNDYAIYMLDTEGQIASWNAGAERISGYRSDEIIGQHFSRFYLAEGQNDWEQELATAASEGRKETEGLRIRKDGTRFLANEIVTPVLDPSGNLKGFAKVTRDITERAEAQREKESLHAQLHQAQKLESVGQLAGGIAHDFNNLLSVILSCSHFVLDDLDEKSELREDIDEIHSAATRAADLTRQLLVFSRRNVVEPQVLNLNDITTGMEKLLRRAAGEKVVLRLDLLDDLHSIKADPGQLEQVLMNLTINARDAMSGSGTLLIETSNVEFDSSSARRYLDLSSGTYIRLRVTDTGCGMSPDVIEKAFDPFFTTKPVGGGTGLGLATVYGIVSQASGDIKINSVEGAGTTFEIHFPAADETDEEASLPVETELQSGNGETVLLVEDEESVRAAARRLLTANGYNVLEAASAEEALEKAGAAAVEIEVLLSDMAMPGMSGVELVDRLTVSHPSLKVIYMSGYSEMLFSSEAVREGAILIQKPFAHADLLSKVRNVIDSKQE